MIPLSTKSLEGNLETLILALLENEESYGYALNLALTEGSDGAIQLKEGTLYPLLHRMEKHGWLICTWQKPAGQRRRKYYAISKEGEQLLAQQRAEWGQLKSVYANLVESGSKARTRRSSTKPSSSEDPQPSSTSVVSDEALPSWLL